METVPDTVILMIFKLLDAENVKNCALVCKRWSKLIGSSSVLMRKFKVRIYMSSEQMRKFREIESIKRKIQSLEIHGRKPFSRFEKEVLAHRGATVKELKLKCCQLIDLTKFDKLERLELRDVFFQRKSRDPVQLVLLKYLKLSNVKNEALSSLVVPNLEVFIAECIFPYNLRREDHPSADPIVNFLKSCEKLKEIQLDNSLLEILFAEDVSSEFRFKLKKISKLVVFNPNVAEFLKSQAESLESLEIWHRNDPQLLKTIYNDLKLKSLTINSKLLDDESAWMRIKRNEHLEELEIFNCFGSSNCVDRLLEKTPGLKHLSHCCQLLCAFRSNLSRVASKLTELETLKVCRIDATFATARFKKLQVLSIYGSWREKLSVEDLKTFLANNPSIHTLRITDCRQDTFIDILQNLQDIANLKYLKINEKTLELSVFRSLRRGSHLQEKVKLRQILQKCSI